jgi:hypothetical protein
MPQGAFLRAIMFWGIITKSYPEHDFDGKISLKRVSKISLTIKVSFNQKFDDSYLITNLIKAGEWRTTCSIDDNSTIQEVIDEIQFIYGLHGDIAKNLTFSYYSHNKNGKKKVKRRFMDEYGEGYDELIIGNKSYIDESVINTQLTTNDINLSIRVPRSTETEKDAACDSAFMLVLLEGVGTSIQAALHWVDREEHIFLFIDNTGGMGQMKQRASMRVDY